MNPEATFDLKAALKQTGVSVRTFKKIARLAIELQDALARNGLVLFCGSSNDDAALAHRETGILLGAFSEPVWMGGDWNERHSSSGVRYNPYLSPTAGQFAEESAANGMPHDEAEARCEAVTGNREGQVPTSAAVEQSEPRPENAPGGDEGFASHAIGDRVEFNEGGMKTGIITAIDGMGTATIRRDDGGKSFRDLCVLRNLSREEGK